MSHDERKHRSSGFQTRSDTIRPSPSLFELVLPFQIKVLFLVLQILVHCCYDAFIASKLCSTKVGFQFWEQIEVRRGHIRRIWGMRKDFESAFSRSSHGNLRRVSKKSTSRQRSGKGAIRKRLPLQKPRWEKTKLTIRYLYHENIS